MVKVQHVAVKVFVERGVTVDLVEAIPVFHRWIRERTVPEILIDVADYRHVCNGPGVVLIGFEADYALDQTKGELGLLYRRKQVDTAGPVEQLRQACRRALVACRRLAVEPEFKGQLRFDEGCWEVIFNDRLLVPNTSESYEAVAGPLRAVFSELWGGAEVWLERVGDPRERLTVRLRRGSPLAAAT